MPQKRRLTAEEKVMLVEGYLAGKMGLGEICQSYGIGNQTLYDWVRLYKVRGRAGLCATMRKRKYAPELKLQAVAEYLSGSKSLRELCTKYDISNKCMLQQWIKRYNSHKGFRQPSNGGTNHMAKGCKTTLQERTEIVSYCSANNKDYGKTIEQYDVSYQQIYGWVRKYEKEGADGLIDRRGKAKDVSCLSEVEKLRAQLNLKEAENLRLQMENDLLKKLEELERRRGIN